MTDLCIPTGKPKMTGAEARSQVKHSRAKAFVAQRCKICGCYHVNSITSISKDAERTNRSVQMRKELRRIRREVAMEDDELSDPCFTP